jgi:hypothetical protein
MRCESLPLAPTKGVPSFTLSAPRYFPTIFFLCPTPHSVVPAEKTLMNDSVNNELFIINLVMVPGSRNFISHLLQAVKG